MRVWLRLRVPESNRCFLWLRICHLLILELSLPKTDRIFGHRPLRSLPQIFSPNATNSYWLKVKWRHRWPSRNYTVLETLRLDRPWTSCDLDAYNTYYLRRGKGQTCLALFSVSNFFALAIDNSRGQSKWSATMAVTNVDIQESSANSSKSDIDEKQVALNNSVADEAHRTTSSHVERDWSDADEYKIRRKYDVRLALCTNR